MLIDTHTHLNEDRLFENRKTHIETFQNTGGKILINAGANPFYNQRGIQISQEAKQFFPQLIIKTTVGIHPCDITKEFKSQIEDIEKLYLQNPEEIVAIGECGVDLHFPESEAVEIQQEGFKLQAELARKHHLPLVIHSRDAFEETFEVLKDFSDLKIYIHSRAYDENALKKCEETFPHLRIGINNIFTYPSAKESRNAVLKKTSAKILTETDAPYLPPQSKRGEINYPHYVQYVYDAYTTQTEKQSDEIEREIEKNVKALFNLEW